MRNIVIVLLSAVLSMVSLAGCREKVKSGTSEVKRPEVSGIGTAVITAGEVNDYYETSGTVKARTVSVISSRIMGTVTSLKVREGDRVRAGQVLLTIDDSDIAQKVRAAGEGYKEADKGLQAAGENRKLVDITYQRYKRLFDDKAISGQELDQIETQKKVADIDYERAMAAVGRAEAGVNEAKVYHGFARISSPVSGVVTGKKTEIGSMAVPGMPLLTVEDTSSYLIEVNVDEKLGGAIGLGMDVEVFMDSVNRDITGRITEVVPSVDSMSRSFLVKIAVQGEGLRNGSYARVSIPMGRKAALLVPMKSVVEKGQLSGVYVVDENSVIRYRLVRVGKIYGDRIEVLSGLKPAEKVVVDGVEKAVDGSVLVPRKQAS